MLKSDFIKKPHQELTTEVSQSELSEFKFANILVKKAISIDYDLDIDYSDQISTVEINGVINFSLLVTDSRTGQDFIYSDSIDWNDEYTFTETVSSQANIIIGENFNFNEYLVEQININLPINISVNSDIINKVGKGWEFISEEEFQNKSNLKSDSRWDKLDEVIIKSKK